MDAIRTFLRKEGGDIKLHLLDHQQAIHGSYPFYFEITLPNFLFADENLDEISRAAPLKTCA